MTTNWAISHGSLCAARVRPAVEYTNTSNAHQVFAVRRWWQLYNKDNGSSSSTVGALHSKLIHLSAEKD